MTATIATLTPPRPGPAVKAVAAWALWRTHSFRTDEIAAALGLHEADVERIIHAVRMRGETDDA